MVGGGDQRQAGVAIAAYAALGSGGMIGVRRTRRDGVRFRVGRSWQRARIPTHDTCLERAQHPGSIATPRQAGACGLAGTR
jgi:hypothetical protein